MAIDGQWMVAFDPWSPRGFTASFTAFKCGRCAGSQHLLSRAVRHRRDTPKASKRRCWIWHKCGTKKGINSWHSKNVKINPWLILEFQYGWHVKSNQFLILDSALIPKAWLGIRSLIFFDHLWLFQPTWAKTKNRMIHVQSSMSSKSRASHTCTVCLCMSMIKYAFIVCIYSNVYSYICIYIYILGTSACLATCTLSYFSPH